MDKAIKLMAKKVLTEKEELWRTNFLRIYHGKKKELGINQEKLAEMCGWKSQGSIAQYSAGGRALNTDAKIKLAWALQVPVTDIDPDMVVIKKTDTPQTASEFMDRNADVIEKMDPTDLMKLAGLIEGYVKAQKENKGN